jgi:Alkylmercury lyase
VTVPLDDEDVRLAVYHGFAATGRAPAVAELGERVGASPDEVRAALRHLHDARHVVLGPEGDIVMAHPFSSVPLGFSVMGARTLWWGGCAWDSFALPHLVPGEPEVLVATRCPACGAPHALVVEREAPPAGGQVAHFLVPAGHMWDDVVATCGNQRLFCDEGCVGAWLDREGRARGDVLDLATLWRLARGWYAGRLERGYTRRDPVTAAAYFREVGLRGAFWGLDGGAAA